MSFAIAFIWRAIDEATYHGNSNLFDNNLNNLYILYIMYNFEKKAWLTVSDVAAYLSLSPEMVYKLAKGGELPAIRIRSSWRIPRDELEQWLLVRRMESRKIILPKLHSQVIRDLERRLKKEYGDLFVALYIFGSTARGTHDKESDLDVLVVLKEVHNRWKEKKRISQMAYDVSFGRGRAIVLSTVIVSEHELINRQDPLLCRIREEGKRAA